MQGVAGDTRAQPSRTAKIERTTRFRVAERRQMEPPEIITRLTQKAVCYSRVTRTFSLFLWSSTSSSVPCTSGLDESLMISSSSMPFS